jgi:ellis van creveld syndrome protein 2
MTMVPRAALHRLLSVVLPTASQPQLLALLDSASERHSDHVAENEGSGEQADLGRSR